MGEKKRYYLFITDQAISGFTATFGAFSTSWIAYMITGSKMAMGSLWMVTLMAQLLTRFLLGPYIDQWSRIGMMRISEGMRLLAYLYLSILICTDHLTIISLYIVAFLTSINVYASAANAILPSIMKKDHLVKSNATISGINQLIRLIALPVSGLLIGLMKPKGTLFLIVLLCLLSLLTLMGLKEPAKPKMKKQKWTRQVTSGITIYKRHKILLFMSLLIGTTSFGVSSTQAMYIPYVSDILKGSSFVYGIFSASFPLGYVMGSFMVGKIQEPKKYLYLTMAGALFAGGITYIGLGLTKTVWVAIAMEVIGGMVMPFWNVHSTTLYQRIVPETLLGQVFSMRFLLTKAANPIGIFYGTFIATHFSLPFMFMSVGMLICFVSGIGMLFLKTGFQKIQSSETFTH